jgi:hypothetical protein
MYAPFFFAAEKPPHRKTATSLAQHTPNLNRDSLRLARGFKQPIPQVAATLNDIATAY